MQLGREAWTGVFPGVPRRKQPWLWTWSFLNYEWTDFCCGGRSQSCVTLFLAGLGNQCTWTFRYHLCSTYKIPWPRSSVMAPGSEARPGNGLPHSTLFCCKLSPSFCCAPDSVSVSCRVFGGSWSRALSIWLLNGLQWSNSNGQACATMTYWLSHLLAPLCCS